MFTLDKEIFDILDIFQRPVIIEPTEETQISNITVEKVDKMRR